MAEPFRPDLDLSGAYREPIMLSRSCSADRPGPVAQNSESSASLDPDHTICAGCGDMNPAHWREGGWYCEGCASCPLCDSPYCEDPSHED
jgi:hypothetical protein